MNKQKIRTIGLLVIVCCFCYSLQAQLRVNKHATPQEMADLLAGQGVTVSNVSISCPGAANGTFKNGNSTILGMDKGVILATGRAKKAKGPNNSGSTSRNFGAPGDADLSAISGEYTFDACVLEFDFVATESQLTLEYVFGSEEYNESVCSPYSDVFAFLVSGPNPSGGMYSNQNFALVPGKNIPISINNVNNGYTGAYGHPSECGDMTNSNYFVDNIGGYTLEYDGLTTVLQAVVDVEPCETYHFKFAIADASDGIADSGVFLKASSFAATNVEAIVTDSDEGCPGGQITFVRSGQNSTDLPINISILGSSTATADDYVPFPLTQVIPSGADTLVVPISSVADIVSEGDESIYFEFSFNDDCNASDGSGTIAIYDGPISCQDYTLYVPDCDGSITPDDVLTGDLSADCPSFTFTLSQTDFTCDDAGDNVVTIMAMNDMGGTSTCDAIVTVIPGVNITVDLGDTCRPVYYGYPPAECETITPVISGGTAPYTYAWSTGENTPSITVCPNETTQYGVTVTDADGNVGVSEMTNVEVVDVRCGPRNRKVIICHVPPGNPNNARTKCVKKNAVPAHLMQGSYLGYCYEFPCDGIPDGGYRMAAWNDEVSEDVAPSIYPNPATNTVYIQDIDHEEVSSVEIFDLQGKLIQRKYGNELSADMRIGLTDEILEGTYVMKVETNSSEIHLLRFVKVN